MTGSLSRVLVTMGASFLAGAVTYKLLGRRTVAVVTTSPFTKEDFYRKPISATEATCTLGREFLVTKNAVLTLSRYTKTKIKACLVLEEVGSGAEWIVRLALVRNKRGEIRLKVLKTPVDRDLRSLESKEITLKEMSRPKKKRIVPGGYDVLGGGILEDYIPNGSLHHYLKTPISLEQKRKIAKNVLLTFAEFICRGNIHGDFKPDNILVDKDNRILIADMGCSSLDDGILRPIEEGSFWLLPKNFEQNADLFAADCRACGIAILEIFNPTLWDENFSLKERCERTLVLRCHENLERNQEKALAAVPEELRAITRELLEHGTRETIKKITQIEGELCLP